MILSIRGLILFLDTSSSLKERGWYICHNHIFIPFTLRYALLLGMGYSVFDWIAGCLTNFKLVMTLYYELYREYLHGFILNRKHYMFLFRLYGFNLTGFYVPLFLFFPRMLESGTANYEGGGIDIHSIAIIDSNALSGDTGIPVVGNDDSFLGTNFYFYLITLHLLRHNIKFVKNWQLNIRKVSKRRFFWTCYYFIFFYRSKNYQTLLTKFTKYFLQIHENTFYTVDENYVLREWSPMATFRFVIGPELHEQINNIDKFVDEYNYK